MHLLNGELQPGFRSRTSTAILMIDLDHCKSVNDTYGHLNGDAVRKEAAGRIARTMRSYDFVGGYGGEEFVAVLSNCPIEDLPNIAESTRIAIAEKPIPTSAGEINVTASIGATGAANEMPVLDLLAAADCALYEAKRSGRNRVRIGSREARRGQEADLLSDRESSCRR
jgi:two-component system, cell cycle response regulator